MTTYYYSKGCVRWRRAPPGDPRGYRPAAGWEAFADLTDIHPITGKQLSPSQWWIRETYTGED